MAKKEFSFTNAVAEIEKILHKIENGDLDVDKLAIEVKAFLRNCHKEVNQDRSPDLLLP